MKRKPFWNPWPFCLLLIPAAVLADGVYFVKDGALLSLETGALKKTSAASVYEYYGTDAKGRPIVLASEPEIGPGYVIQGGAPLVALNAAGQVDAVLDENALRAYPSPSGNKIAVLGADFSVTVLANGKAEPVAFSKPVTLVSWSPDETQLCLTAYPEDWSPYNANNASGPDEFLRLQNSDLYLVTLASGESRQLTNEPGYDYSGLFTPDGSAIIFISSRSGRGAFYSYDLSSNGVTQLTNHASGSYDIPVGRSDTFAWDKANGRFVYEAQQTEKTSTIRALSREGNEAITLGPGEQPRVLDDGRVVFLTPDGVVKFASSSKESGS